MVRLKKKNLIENEKEIVSLNPKKLINHFYEKVDLTTAAVVIFISIFLETLFLLFLRSPGVLSYFTVRIIVTFLFSWFILGGLLYLVLYFVKGRDKLKGDEFKKILSGLASFRVISIFSLLFVLFIILVFLPKILPFASLVLQNPSILQTGFMPSLGAGALFGLILLMIFGVFLIVYLIVMMYHFVKKMYNFESDFSNVIMTIIILIIMLAFSALLF